LSNTSAHHLRMRKAPLLLRLSDDRGEALKGGKAGLDAGLLGRGKL
jgi:hypothetical protein